jgi:Carboxypeptidase regulatory-like domain
MLYLALPPAPPAIVATVIPKQATDNSPTENAAASGKPKNASVLDNGKNSASTAQKLNCTPLFKSNKSDLVNTLLTRMLATSAQGKGQSGICVQNKNKSVVVNFQTTFQTEAQKSKSAKGFSRKVSDKVKKPSIEAATKPSKILESEQVQVSANGNSANTTTPKPNSGNLNSSPQQSQKLASSTPEKNIEKNPISKILAAVQEIISVSLYASINNAINETVEAETEVSKSEENTSNNTNQNNQINPETSNQEQNNQEQNNQEQEVASIDVRLSAAKILAVVQELISASLYASINNTIDETVKTETEKPGEISGLTPPPKPLETPISNSTVTSDNTSNNKKPEENQLANQAAVPANSNPNPNLNNSTSEQVAVKPPIELARNPGESFLVGVLINGREVGTLDIIQEGNTLLIPLENLGDIAGFSVTRTGIGTEVRTPLGTVTLQPNSLRQINGVVYISQVALQKELSINIELNTADLTLLTDLPWRGSRADRAENLKLKPEIFAPGSGISTFRQELNLSTSRGDTNFRTSSILGGRLGGGIWRLRLDNNFENQPDISEYFYYKRNGNFRYQIGRQQLGLHPLLTGIDLTGLQFGFSNLPAENFTPGYGANELLPRRSRPVQSFRGQVPPASFVQLRVGGVVAAQQQVGFNGQYEFIDVNLPVGQSNEIDVLVFDRNNLRVPIEIRSVRMNASDLLLPAGGNVQLAGLGFSGNLAQNTFFDNYTNSLDGKPVGFYQMRQGLSSNLTLEGGIQAIPDFFQAQAGLVWRLANPMIVSASVGTSNEKLGYSADVDIQLDKLEIFGNSQTLPQGYRPGRNVRDLFNHSLELRYRFGNQFNLGFIARSRQDDGSSANYILPTFTARPFSNLSMSGRPDIDGRYLFNAFFQPNLKTRLSFNSYGDSYLTDLSYNLGGNYQLLLGNEFGGNLAPRYSVGIGRSSSDLRQLSWNLGIALRDGDVAPVAGASMQVLPGLLARIDYQGIPTRARGALGGFGDERLTLSLVSDLSFGGGRVTPTNYSGLGKERGAIAGRLVVSGDDKGKGFDLSNSVIRVYDTRNRNVGSGRTDSSGNFFVGNLPEGVYVVELQPDELPIELSTGKTSMVAEVAAAGVTKLDFPLRAEFGLAGRITDVANQPISQVRVELVNAKGARIMSSSTDQFGLYRMDGVPVGSYILRVSPQDELNPNDSLPKRPVEIRNEFVFNQNLQLPVSAASKKK